MDGISTAGHPLLSAVYYALLQCGYEYYQMARCDDHIEKIKTFVSPTPSFSWFSDARQATCEVYPYWPRAALLELASFYIDTRRWCFCNEDTLRRKIMETGNLTDEERNSDFWDWLQAFPAHLQSVMEYKGFQAYLSWENTWIEKQSLIWQNEINALQKVLAHCNDCFHYQLPFIELVINPIKCVYSADYHLFENRFVYTSGRMNPSFVIHEFLHPVVHPLLTVHRDRILHEKAVYADIDSSYYLGGTDNGYLNAFEEKLVRALTDELVSETPPQSIQSVMDKLLPQ